jgi:single-strand DNA-binding protein
MNDLNRVQLIGHLGHDPEVTYTEQGTARTTFSVATSYHGKDANGQEQETTEWSRCVAWGALAEVCAQYVAKGSRVYVAGRLHTVRWEDAQTGERHARVEIVLDDLILLDRRGGAREAATDDGAPLPCSS